MDWHSVATLFRFAEATVKMMRSSGVFSEGFSMSPPLPSKSLIPEADQQPANATGGTPPKAAPAEGAAPKPTPAAPSRKPEIGGPRGPEPTRYGDWEKAGRCIDF